MRIKRLNENVKYINPMEICLKCGSQTVHLFDNLSLYHPDEFKLDGMNFDEEIYASTICDNCGNKEKIRGKITWKIDNKEKRKKYAKSISKGVNPLEIEKYNL